MKTTELAIFRALSTVFPAPAHTLLSQVRNGTGFSRGPRTADALAISTYPSRGLWMAGVEIKTYLGDWKRELANPEKAESISKYCHLWYVAAPEGLIPQNELPETWGLIEVGKKAKIVVKGKNQEPKAIDMLLLCSILRNFSESYVPKSEVEVLAEEKAKKMEEHRGQELENLRTSIAEFEKASGIKLKDHFWEYGDIGKAVKVVIDSGILRRSDRIQALRLQAAQVVESCDKILSSCVQVEK